MIMTRLLISMIILITVIFLILLNNHYHEDHDQAAYLRTLAAPRAPQYLQPPPSFAPTQGEIIILFLFVIFIGITIPYLFIFIADVAPRMKMTAAQRSSFQILSDLAEF